MQDLTMEIRSVPIDRLNQAPYNPRKDLKHDDLEYQKLERSIKEFGYVDPVIWNETTGNVVGGHQRLKILTNMGKTEIEVSVVNLDEMREKALNVALNNISGEWNDLYLEVLMSELRENGLDELTGFDEEEISRMISETEEKISASTEVQLSEFQNDKFQCECPKCGFMFNLKK